MNGDICFSLIRNREKYHHFGRLLVAPGVSIVTVISYSLQRIIQETAGNGTEVFVHFSSVRGEPG